VQVVAVLGQAPVAGPFEVRSGGQGELVDEARAGTRWWRTRSVASRLLADRVGLTPRVDERPVQAVAAAPT